MTVYDALLRDGKEKRERMEAQERADMDDNEITPADATTSLYQFAARVLTLRTEGEKLNARQSTQLDEALCLLAIDMRKAADRDFRPIEAAVAAERERLAQLFDTPVTIHGEAEDWCREVAARIRGAA